MSVVRARSLNDLLHEEGGDVLQVPLKASWSFTNLLPVGAADDLGDSREDLALVDDDAEAALSGLKDASAPKEGEKAEERPPQSLLRSFQQRLAKQVKVSLDEAVQGDNNTVIKELFFNVSSSIPRSTAEELGLSSDRKWYYYELLATHYYSLERTQPGWIAKTLLPLFAKLWSQDHFVAVFALLFHRWLIGTDAGLKARGAMMRFNVLLKGTYQLFWFDVHHDTRKIWPLYVRLRDNLFGADSRFFKASREPHGDAASAGDAQLRAAAEEGLVAWDDGLELNTYKSIRKDFAYVLCRFYFHYTSRPERVMTFVNELQLEGGLDEFTPQLVIQLRSLRDESVLQRYLKCTARLPIEELSMEPRNKLYSALNELQMPGAPLYPSSRVTVQAEKTMNKLFPQGQWARFGINLIFKALRSLYLPASLLGVLDKVFKGKED